MAAARSRAAARPWLSVSASVMPATGSSTSSSSGSCTSSMPISSHCFWPWLSSPARRLRGVREPDDRPAPRRSGRAARPTGRRTSERNRARSPFSASSRLVQTVWLSNTVGFWNFRPMPSRAIVGLVVAGEVDVLAEQDGALVGPGLAGDHVHHRGLAGAVRADDRAHLALVEVEREIVQRLEAVEADRDAVEIEDRARRAAVVDRCR